jgi:hypothetical protein
LEPFENRRLMGLAAPFGAVVGGTKAGYLGLTGGDVDDFGVDSTPISFKPFEGKDADGNVTWCDHSLSLV